MELAVEQTRMTTEQTNTELAYTHELIREVSNYGMYSNIVPKLSYWADKHPDVVECLCRNIIGYRQLHPITKEESSDIAESVDSEGSKEMDFSNGFKMGDLGRIRDEIECAMTLDRNMVVIVPRTIMYGSEFWQNGCGLCNICGRAEISYYGDAWIPFNEKVEIIYHVPLCDKCSMLFSCSFNRNNTDIPSVVDHAIRQIYCIDLLWFSHIVSSKAYGDGEPILFPIKRDKIDGYIQNGIKRFVRGVGYVKSPLDPQTKLTTIEGNDVLCRRSEYFKIELKLHKTLDTKKCLVYYEAADI